MWSGGLAKTNYTQTTFFCKVNNAIDEDEPKLAIEIV
jgi:hypothetical protein